MVYGKNRHLFTLTERVLKMLLAVRIKCITKRAVAWTTKKMLAPFKSICKTIILYDSGKFTAHESIAHELDDNIYFAKHYHFWQSEPNKNSKSLLCLSSPKGMKIVGQPKKEIETVQGLINMRHQKSLSYLTSL